jgi:hypothetical protein
MGKGKIRIIKQGAVRTVPGSQSAPMPREKLVKDPAAKLISNIAGWVTEFKERPRTDPRIKFRSLFKEA